MHPKLVHLAAVRSQQRVHHAVVGMDQLDQGLGVRLLGLIDLHAHLTAELLDVVAVHDGKRRERPVHWELGDRFVDLLHLPPSRRAAGRRRGSRGASRTSAVRPSLDRGGGSARGRHCRAGCAARTRAEFCRNLPPGVVGRKCGLSTTTRWSSRCRISISNGIRVSDGGFAVVPDELDAAERCIAGDGRPVGPDDVAAVEPFEQTLRIEVGRSARPCTRRPSARSR